ncbi:uncharacterized protein LOC117223924 [Megalopta genalis]|uniref:uncharacterized protein LOC117223924 n=1 Tax=Megalopta genalis TaxID=115081 RepID=UPI003FD0D7E9
MLHSMLTIYGVVAILYYIYTELVINSLQSHNSVNTLSCYLLDTMYAWLKVVVTCYFCEKTAKEAKQIVHIIHVCSIHNSDIGLKNELVQFCQQVSLTEVNLETRHLFRLNDGFILQSMGSIFTYFLIMIQWSQMVDVHGSSSNLTAIN